MKMGFLGRTCLIVLSLLPAVSTQEWSSVVGSDQPLIASPGEDVILPCHITPSLSAVDMEVRWYRENFNIPVHLYEYQSDWTDVQDSDYRGRTDLSGLGLEDGILSLDLRNLRYTDSGVYSCFATDGAWYGQGKTELIVRALGTQPSISMDSTQGEQTRLVCRSEGWSPEPEVIWRDRDGNDVTSLSNTTLLRVSQGLRSVSSYIKIKQQSNVFSCLVRSKIPKPDWESKLHISRDFFPGVSRWMVAFFLTLALSIGTIPLLVIKWRRMDATERKLEYLAVEHLRKELETIEHIPKSEWKALRNLAVDMTLDPNTAHPLINLKGDRKEVIVGGKLNDTHDNPERFDCWACVLGKEGFTSGKQYWEVEVGSNKEWRLGVTKESAQRKGWFDMTPEQGYWIIRCKGDSFFAVTDPETPLPLRRKPRKVGVYLDCEEDVLSFYNVDTECQIFQFSIKKLNANEKLFPVLCTWDMKSKNIRLVLMSRIGDGKKSAG